MKQPGHKLSPLGRFLCHIGHHKRGARHPRTSWALNIDIRCSRYGENLWKGRGDA